MKPKQRVLNILQTKPVDRIPVDIWHTPEDVRKEKLHCLETPGGGREGFICSSCHNIQAGTPVENILTMIETVKNW